MATHTPERTSLSSPVDLTGAQDAGEPVGIPPVVQTTSRSLVTAGAEPLAAGHLTRSVGTITHCVWTTSFLVYRHTSTRRVLVGQFSGGISREFV
jgi:hypothetical protein